MPQLMQVGNLSTQRLGEANIPHHKSSLQCRNTFLLSPDVYEFEYPGMGFLSETIRFRIEERYKSCQKKHDFGISGGKKM